MEPQLHPLPRPTKRDALSPRLHRGAPTASAPEGTPRRRRRRNQRVEPREVEYRRVNRRHSASHKVIAEKEGEKIPRRGLRLWRSRRDGDRLDLRQVKLNRTDSRPTLREFCYLRHEQTLFHRSNTNIRLNRCVLNIRNHGFDIM